MAKIKIEQPPVNGVRWWRVIESPFKNGLKFTARTKKKSVFGPQGPAAINKTF